MRKSPVLVLIVGLAFLGIGLAYNAYNSMLLEVTPILRNLPSKEDQEAVEAAKRAEAQRTPRRVQEEAERRALEMQKKAAAEDPRREAQLREAAQLEALQREIERRYAEQRAQQREEEVSALTRPPADLQARRRQEEELRQLELRLWEIEERKSKLKLAPDDTLISARLETGREAEQQLYDRLTASMRSARYAFNHPEVMYLSRRHQITLTLAADEKTALEEHGRQFEKGAEGTVRTGETKYAPVMLATLRGKDFKIEPPDGKEQIVLSMRRVLQNGRGLSSRSKPERASSSSCNWPLASTDATRICRH